MARHDVRFLALDLVLVLAYSVARYQVAHGCPMPCDVTVLHVLCWRMAGHPAPCASMGQNPAMCAACQAICVHAVCDVVEMWWNGMQ